MSTLVLDTITGKSTATTITIGSTPVVSASANSMTIRGEGSAQTSIQQGLAKQWLHFNGTGTIAIVDSFNTTSITDVATGEYTVTIANDMANIGYSKTATGAQNNAVGPQIIKVDYGRNGNAYVAPTVTAYRVQNFLASNADAADTQYLNATAHGDLA